MRQFTTGATRDTDDGKLDFEGFLSPYALRRFAEYMHKNRVQADGGLRDSDNWQKGIPLDAYMKSMWRHFFDVWEGHRLVTPEKAREQTEALCALLFNAMGYLHELEKGRVDRVTHNVPVTVNFETEPEDAIKRAFEYIRSYARRNGIGRAA